MKKIFLLIPLLFLAGCSYSSQKIVPLLDQENDNSSLDTHLQQESEAEENLTQEQESSLDPLLWEEVQDEEYFEEEEYNGYEAGDYIEPWVFCKDKKRDNKAKYTRMESQRFGRDTCNDVIFDRIEKKIWLTTCEPAGELWEYSPELILDCMFSGNEATMDEENIKNTRGGSRDYPTLTWDNSTLFAYQPIIEADYESFELLWNSPFAYDKNYVYDLAELGTIDLYRIIHKRNKNSDFVPYMLGGYAHIDENVFWHDRERVEGTVDIATMLYIWSYHGEKVDIIVDKNSVYRDGSEYGIERKYLSEDTLIEDKELWFVYDLIKDNPVYKDNLFVQFFKEQEAKKKE